MYFVHPQFIIRRQPKLGLTAFLETPINELVGDHLMETVKIFKNVGNEAIDYDAHMLMKIVFLVYKVYRDVERPNFSFYNLRAS